MMFKKALTLSSTPVEISHIRQEKIVRKFKIWKIFSFVFVLASLVAGCKQNRKQKPLPALPAVLATFPADGANGVVTNTTVIADFSSVMNPITINAATFTFKGPGGTLVEGAVSYAGTTAIFTPTVALAANTLYLATITTGAKDSVGAALAANFVWTFTAAVPPAVVFTIPAKGITAVAVNALLSASFSRALDPATITSATFTVTAPETTPVAATVGYTGTVATFGRRPFLPLAPYIQPRSPTGRKTPRMWLWQPTLFGHSRRLRHPRSFLLRELVPSFNPAKELS